jgi:hypothetical protein
MGKQHDRGSMEEQRKLNIQQGAGTEEEYVEVGLIEDIIEKTIQN